MSAAPFRYRSPDEDSARWARFAFRPGDIVISTRSKSGTTWMQMICALLVLRTPELPSPLAELSPWLDWLVEPEQDVLARLDAQRHRRLVKTHTPLDGVPIDPRATYIVVARHPLDMAVSLYHQGDNLDRPRLRALTGQPEPFTPSPARPTLSAAIRMWVDSDDDPRTSLDSLAGVMWHYSDAWARRHEPNVVLVHYNDLAADLDGEMRRIAGRLGETVPDDRWAELVQAATFEQMRGRAEWLVPDRAGVLKDANAFFRRGSSGSGREVFGPEGVARYHQRAAEIAPPDLLEWLHHDC
jgi:aryl sulfotransferase